MCSTEYSSMTGCTQLLGTWEASLGLESGIRDRVSAAQFADL